MCAESHQYRPLLATTGGAYCWGYNQSGRLGDGTTKNSSVPVRVGGNW